jgi:hypothetical protein
MPKCSKAIRDSVVDRSTAGPGFCRDRLGGPVSVPVRVQKSSVLRNDRYRTYRRNLPSYNDFIRVSR